MSTIVNTIALETFLKPVFPWLDQEGVSELSINKPGEIWIEKGDKPLPRKVTERIFMECVRRGLLTMSYAASFRLQPALTIDEATALGGLAILSEVFEQADREKWMHS